MLKFIKEVDLGSGVRKASATDIFTSDYDNFFVTVTDLTSPYSIGNFSPAYFIDTSDSDITTANYFTSTFDRATYTTPSGENVYSNQTKIQLAFVADANPESPGLQFWVFNPMNSSSYTMMAYKQNVSNTVGQGTYQQSATVLKENTQVAGIAFEHVFTGQVLDGGTLRSYGLE